MSPADIPTALTAQEAQLLTHLAYDKLVYEAGALLGASTVALAQRARFVVSVDPHDGYPRKDPSPTWEQYHYNLGRAGVRDRVQAVRLRFQDVPPVAAYDLAFADLTGERDLTFDFLWATRHIPLVAVHDFARAGCAGVEQAVDLFVKRYPRRLTRVDTLLVLEAT